MESLNLDEILVENGITREQLDKPCTKKDRDFIAVEEWSIKLLAHSIGLSPQQARDCEEDNQTPEERRRALLEKWYQKNGSKATYLKLAEGFAEIGRRDIVEKIIERSSSNHHEREHAQKILLTTTTIGTVFSLIIAMIVNYFYLPLNLQHQNQLNTTHNKSAITINNSVKYDIGLFHKPITWNTTFCEVKDAQNNLPTISTLFVGRDRDVAYISNTLQFNQDVHIININGPPAFGKSSLAIHVGHELVRRCIRVRYIDTTEHFLFQKIKKKSHENVVQIFGNDNTELQTHGGGTIQSYINSAPQNDKQDPNLLKWAETVKHPTLLILDNCDEVLHSELRDDFLQSVQSYHKLSRGNIKTIITSQEQLLLLDNFQSWTIRELDLNASVNLLKALIQDITFANPDAEKLIKEVGGCPLALKVIGKVLSSSKLVKIPTLLSQLQNNPLGTVDKVSEKKHKFSHIMDIAYGYLSEDEQQCAVFTSLFPGSFDSEASHAILSQFPKCSNGAEYLTQRSLLEEYYLHVQQRFRIHRLIREYFHEKSNDVHMVDFNHAFILHYLAFILNYTMLYLTQGIDEVHEHRLVTESHNTMYLSQTWSNLWMGTFLQLFRTSSHDNHVLHKFSELVIHFSKPQHYNNGSIETIFAWAISPGAVTFVCEVLKGQCTSYYSVVFDKIHEAVCGNSSVESCESLYTCNVTELATPICLKLKLNVSNFCTHIPHFTQSCSSSIRVLYKPLKKLVKILFSIGEFSQMRTIILFCFELGTTCSCIVCMIILYPLSDSQFITKNSLYFCIHIIFVLFLSVMVSISLYQMGCTIVKFVRSIGTLENTIQQVLLFSKIPTKYFHLIDIHYDWFEIIFIFVMVVGLFCFMLRRR